MIETREHFRAPVSDEQFALLVVGLQRITVQLLDQSSGGLSMLAARTPEFACEAQAEVKFGDGYCITGLIKHIDPCDKGFRIGFQRGEMIQAKKVDLRDAFTVGEERSQSPLTFAVVLIVGLSVGLLWQTGTAQKLYDRAAAAIRASTK